MLPFRFIGFLALAGLAVTGLSGQFALADEAPLETGAEIRINARYSSSVLIFKVGEITMSARMSDTAYLANTHIEAAGLAALFTDFDIQAEVSGQRGQMLSKPQNYSHIERTGDKVRSVEVSFRDAIARAEVEPPFGSLGQPPASDLHRTDTVDPMSALFLLSEMTASSEEGVCSGRIPVFDGKARYDLRLVSDGFQNIRTRAWQGEALVCQAWYEPIAGYDPEDYPSEDELSHPLTIWLAPFQQGDIHIPVRLHTRAGFGGVTIQAISLDFQAPQNPR